MACAARCSSTPQSTTRDDAWPRLCSDRRVETHTTHGRMGMKRLAFAIAFALCTAPGVLGAQSVTVNETSNLREQPIPTGGALMVSAPAATVEENKDKAIN